MVQKYTSGTEPLPPVADYVHWETQQPVTARRATRGASERRVTTMPDPAASEPEPEPAPEPASPTPTPEPVPVPAPAASSKPTAPAAEVMRRLEAVQARVKGKKTARPGDAAGSLAEVVEAVALAGDDLSSDEASYVFSVVEAALQRVYDDCAAGTAGVQQQQQQPNTRLVVEHCAAIGLSANQRGKLKKWEGRLAALEAEIEERERLAAAESFALPPAALARQLGREMFALFLERAPDGATVAAQREVVARIDDAIKHRTGHRTGCVHVFGSSASGFGGSGSDIDLCAELPKEQAKTNQLFASLRQHKARLAQIEAEWPEIARRGNKRKELEKEISTQRTKVTRLGREIQGEKSDLMRRATANAAQLDALRRTVIVKLTAPPQGKKGAAAKSPPAPAAPAEGEEGGAQDSGSKEGQNKSPSRSGGGGGGDRKSPKGGGGGGGGAKETSPSQAELEELAQVISSDEFAWPLVREVRPPEWGLLVVAPPSQAFRSSARLEFSRPADMEAAVQAAKAGKLTLPSSGRKVKLRTVGLRAVVVEEVEAFQRGEVRSGWLHDAELALEKTTQRLEAATTALKELEEAAVADSSPEQVAAAAETERLLQQCARWINDLEKQGKITYHFRNVMQVRVHTHTHSYIYIYIYIWIWI